MSMGTKFNILGFRVRAQIYGKFRPSFASLPKIHRAFWSHVSILAIYPAQELQVGRSTDGLMASERNISGA
jgi:hypothetical protein